MKETVKIGKRLITIERLRVMRWPNGQWRVYCGGDESTGPTKADAIYNFRREHPPKDLKDE